MDKLQQTGVSHPLDEETFSKGMVLSLLYQLFSTARRVKEERTERYPIVKVQDASGRIFLTTCPITHEVRTETFERFLEGSQLNIDYFESRERREMADQLDISKALKEAKAARAAMKS